MSDEEGKQRAGEKQKACKIGHVGCLVEESKTTRKGVQTPKDLWFILYYMHIHKNHKCVP